MLGIMNIVMLSLVGAGGAMGAMLRFWVGSLLAPLSIAGQFPYGTLVINLLGSCALGLLAGLLMRANDGGYASSALYLLLGTGVLGGFTTFSTFSLEVVQMIDRGATASAIVYVLASVAGGIALAWAGIGMTR